MVEISASPFMVSAYSSFSSSQDEVCIALAGAVGVFLSGSVLMIGRSSHCGWGHE
jgi:hypothetical protein